MQGNTKNRNKSALSSTTSKGSLLHLAIHHLFNNRVQMQEPINVRLCKVLMVFKVAIIHLNLLCIWARHVNEVY